MSRERVEKRLLGRPCSGKGVWYSRKSLFRVASLFGKERTLPPFFFFFFSDSDRRTARANRGETRPRDLFLFTSCVEKRSYSLRTRRAVGGARPRTAGPPQRPTYSVSIERVDAVLCRMRSRDSPTKAVHVVADFRRHSRSCFKYRRDWKQSEPCDTSASRTHITRTEILSMMSGQTSRDLSRRAARGDSRGRGSAQAADETRDDDRVQEAVSETPRAHGRRAFSKESAASFSFGYRTKLWPALPEPRGFSLASSPKRCPHIPGERRKTHLPAGASVDARLDARLSALEATHADAANQRLNRSIDLESSWCLRVVVD